MKFIDLSIPIINPEEVLFDPPMTQPRIEYSDHDTGVEQMGFIFSRLKAEHLPVGKGWAVESITLGTHTGTHMDARSNSPNSLYLIYFFFLFFF